MVKIVCVCGARPNVMKVAPLMAAFHERAGILAKLVHTGQHYDERMSRLFFTDLGLAEPELNLEVGSASHAVQTAEVMRRFEPVCEAERPDWVVVVGDVNSTLACALVAAKLGTAVAHVEAGLRSFDRTMPEEINRVLTDAVSDLLFVTERSGVENLRREGINDSKIHLVGNVMVDTLLANRDRARVSTILSELGLETGGYGVVTLHRPANVDRADVLSGILDGLEQIGQDMPVVFPIHPRTRKNLERLGLASRVGVNPAVRFIEPLGYLDFLRLMSECAFVLTDSGGIQEETTILGVPCLTARPHTERPVTIEQGTNRLVGSNPRDIVAAFRQVRSNPPRGRIPELWDGQAAKRIAAIVAGLS